jgi:hypothetical protein
VVVSVSTWTVVVVAVVIMVLSATTFTQRVRHPVAPEELRPRLSVGCPITTTLTAVEGQVLYDIQVDVQPIVAQSPVAAARSVPELVVLFSVRISDGQ